MAINMHQIEIMKTWCCLFTKYVHDCLFLGVANSLVWHQWMVDTSIADGITSTGYITSKTTLTSAKCIIECTQMPACKMVGFSEDDGTCNLYSLILTNDLSFGFQSSTTFYKGIQIKKNEKKKKKKKTEWLLAVDWQ